LAAVAAAIAVDQSSRPEHRFPKAKPVATTRGVITNALMDSGYDSRPRSTISWFLQSNHVISSFHRNPAGLIGLHQFDLARPAALATVYPAALAENGTETLSYWAPSPDGRWLLTVRRLDQRRFYRVFGADHALHASWTNRHEGRSQPDWLNDSSGFVEWPIREGRLLARVHWLDTFQTSEVDLLALPAYRLDGPGPLTQPCVALLYSPPPPGIATEFLILAPTRDPDGWKRAILSLPEGLHRHEQPRVTLSPTADQLAWLCDSTNRLPRLSFSRLPPFVHVLPRSQSSLFVSRPDGSQLTPLGRTQPGTTVAAVRWSPAGDHLSFFYQDVLWLQPLTPLPE
jgi:hypothetical protein